MSESMDQTWGGQEDAYRPPQPQISNAAIMEALMAMRTQMTNVQQQTTSNATHLATLSAQTTRQREEMLRQMANLSVGRPGTGQQVGPGSGFGQAPVESAAGPTTNQNVPDQNEQLRTLIEATTGRPKITHPDPFTGTDSENVNQFVNKCNRVFNYDGNVEIYRPDRVRIAFAVNLLDGKAYDWIEPYEEMPLEERPPFCKVWSLFEMELRRKFSAVDKREEARLKLNKLRQKKDVASYATEFDLWISRLHDYPDNVRRDMFFTGLKKHIRLKFLAPANHLSYRDLVHKCITFDRQYTQQDNDDQQSSGGNGNARANDVDSGPTPMDVDAMTIGKKKKVQKLSQEERQRRLENGLCFGCGKSGHISKYCPDKKSKAKTETVAAVADNNADAGSSKSGN
jgi:hypothetical protein